MFGDLLKMENVSFNRHSLVTVQVPSGGEGGLNV